MNSEFNKLGGWLLVFYVLSILSALFSIPSLFTLIRFGFSFNAFRNLNFTILFILAFLTFTLQVYRIYILPKQDPETHRRLILIQFSEFAIAVVIILLTLQADFSRLFSGVIGTAIWLVYLKSSERVNVFYKLDF